MLKISYKDIIPNVEVMKKKNKKQSHLHGYRKMASAGHELRESINALTLLEGKTDTRNTH